MFWKNGIFCSALVGFIWGGFWQIIFTVLSILTLGLTLSLELLPFIISSILIALIFIFLNKKINIRKHVSMILLTVSLIYISTIGDPYNRDYNNFFVIFILVTITSTFIWLSIYFSLKNISTKNLTRYQTKNFI